MNLQIIIIYFLMVNWWFCGVKTHENGKNNTTSENMLFRGNSMDCRSFQNADAQIGLPQRKWISELFYEAHATFRLNSYVNTECKRDFDLFKLHLTNQTTWAVKMMESSEWPLVGILFGAVDYMGNYDECLSISSYGIDGQYCLVEAVYNYSHILHSEIVELPDEKISAWEVLTMYGKNPVRRERKKLKFAMCVPSSCKPIDLKISLDSTLRSIFNAHGLNITVNVDPLLCKIRHESARPSGYYIVRNLFLTLCFFVVCSTLFDIVTSARTEVETEDSSSSEPRNNLIKQVSKIFSISENFRELTKYDCKSQLTGIHFAKVLNIIFVICGHRLLAFAFPFPSSDTFIAEQEFKKLIVGISRQSLVDIFFLISGFLSMHFEVSKMVKGGMFFLIITTLSRWMRMIPTFGVLMLYTIYILPYIGDGPIWNYSIMNEVNNCKESWWATVFAINNFVKIDKQCHFFSWYITTDIQLSIIGGILLYIFTKNRKVGIFAVVFSFMVSTTATFFITYTKQLQGILQLYSDAFKNIRNVEEYHASYIATCGRCGPYLLGFMTAYVLRVLKQNKINFTKTQVYLYSFISILISEASSVYGSTFYAFNKKYSAFESALFAALSRVIFVSHYAIIGLFYFTSGLGIFTKLVEWKMWIPLGRLTYSVFLINTLIQLHHASSQKQPVTSANYLNLILWFLGDIILSYSVGLILHLFVEAPISNLNTLIKRQLFKRLQNRTVTNESQYNKSQLSKNKNK